MQTIESLETRIKAIEGRNMSVEINKAWETSITRRIILLILTFLAIGIYLNAIGVTDPWLNAIVPAIGFMLSTLTLPFFKRIWQHYIFKAR